MIVFKPPRHRVENTTFKINIDLAEVYKLYAITAFRLFAMLCSDTSVTVTENQYEIIRVICMYFIDAHQLY